MNIYDLTETQWKEKERKAYIEGDTEKALLYGFIVELLQGLEKDDE